MPPKKRKAAATTLETDIEPIPKKTRVQGSSSPLSDPPETLVDPSLEFSERVANRQLAAEDEKEDILSKLNRDFKEVLAQFNIEDNKSLRNIRNIKRFLNNVDLVRYVAPYAQAEHERLISALRDEAQIPNKVVQLERVKQDKGRWTCVILDNQGRPGYEGLKKPKSFSCGIPEVMLPLDKKNKGESKEKAIEIGQLICDMRNRMDIGVPNTSTNNMIMRVACQLKLGVPQPVMIPEYKKTPTGYTVKQYIRHLDSKTGLHFDTEIFVTPSTLADVDIDDIPEIPHVPDHQCYNQTYHAIDKVVAKDGFEGWPSRMPASLVKQGGPALTQARATEKFLIYAAYKLSNLIATEDRIREMVNDLKQEFGIPVPGLSEKRIYGGRGLLHTRISVPRTRTSIFLSHRPMQDLSTQLKISPYIVIKSLNSARAVLPMDIGLQHYVTGKDTRIAFLYCAQAADVVNQDIIEMIPVSATCECSKEMSRFTKHHCFECLHETVCAELDAEILPGSRVCPRCKKSLSLGITKDTIDVVEPKVMKSIRGSHKRECSHVGADVESHDEKKRLLDMQDKLKEGLPDDPNVWMDRYTQRTITVPPGGEYGYLRHPAVISVDAVEPYALSHDGKIRTHTASNVAVTSAVLNYTKYINLPGFLEELGRYRRGDLSPDAQLAFSVKCDILHEIRFKVPYTKKARTQHDSDNLEADQAEWRSGQLLEEEGPWDDKLWRFVIQGSPIAPRNGWDKETTERLARISRQIQKKFKKTLQTAKDGAPWIADESGEKMPTWWSWSCWFALLTERVIRMEFLCNKWWKQEDSTESLFCEFVWQLCTSSSDYKEFLGLPRTVWLRHPLRFSVAHRHHGEQMRSGWPLHPQDISDREDTLNNMFFETWTSNIAKMDSPEHVYGLITEMIDAINVPLELYNPGLVLTATRDAVKVDLTEDDMYREGNNVMGAGSILNAEAIAKREDGLTEEIEAEGAIEAEGEIEATEGQSEHYESDDDDQPYNPDNDDNDEWVRPTGFFNDYAASYRNRR